jgi:hypothetical protein
VTVSSSDMTPPPSRRAVLRLFGATYRDTAIVSGQIVASTGARISVCALARQSFADTMQVLSDSDSHIRLKGNRDRAMIAASVIDRTTAEIANRVVARLTQLQVPEMERVALHRDGEWVNIWLICSSYPLQHADAIYAIEPELVMAFSDVYISLRIISRYGQDVSTLAHIADDSLVYAMVS